MLGGEGGKPTGVGGGGMIEVAKCGKNFGFRISDFGFRISDFGF